MFYGLAYSELIFPNTSMALVAKAEAKSEAEAKLTCHCALADAIDGSMLGPGTWPSALN